MRILFGTYALAFQNPGGGEQVLLTLQKELTRQGHEVDLFNPWNHSPARYDVIHWFSCLENSIWLELRRHAPHTPLFVTPTLWIKPGARARLALWKQKALTHFVPRGGAALDRFKLVDRWLPTTSHEAQLLGRYWEIPKPKIQVLPNGVEPHFNQDNDPNLFRNQFGIQGPFILHVGRFHPVKNHLTLIQSVAKIQGQAVFIGGIDLGAEAYYRHCVEAARRAEVADSSGKTRFHFIAPFTHEDPLLASAYSAANVFALPSQFETFGLSALEAAVSGTPLVLSRNVWSREVFQDIAKFVDPNSVTELAQCLNEALKSPKPAANQTLALQKNHSWDGISRQLAGIYESL